MQFRNASQLEKNRGKFTVFVILIAIATVLAGCGGNNGGKSPAENKIAIAEQYGLAYAPLQIIRAQQILEQKLPGVEIEWLQLGNTAEIREAMLAGKLDAGFMAIPPFLIGWDKGMEWRIASGLSSSPVGLVTNKEDIRSLKDFTSTDRIVVPQPGSVQHILLAMASRRELGDSKKLDNLLVTMKHPDGMNALLSNKDITAHFTAMPYLYEELQNQGMRNILSGEEAMGREFTFIVGVTTKEFHDANPKGYKAFVESLQEAVEFILNNPEQTAEILAEEYKLSKEEVLNYLTFEDTEYSTTVKGIHEFAEFMTETGYLSKSLENVQDVLWEDVNYEN